MPHLGVRVRVVTTVFFLGLSTGRVAGAAEGPIFRWQLTAEHASNQQFEPTVGPLKLQYDVEPQFDERGPHALTFDAARTKRFFLKPNTPFTELKLPAEQLTADAWVRVDKVAEWGGVFGALQDNGTYERGWLLGYRRSQFFFGLSSQKNKRLTYLTDPGGYETGQWYHLVGTWDGTTLSLYVDGKLAATSKEQSGAIAYPEEAHFGVGAYWDSNEFYGLTGQVEQVSLWDRTLSRSQVREQFDARKKRFPDIDPVPEKVVDWPTHLRDNGRTGMVPEAVLNWPLSLRWSHKTRHAPSPAWPPPALQNFWHKKTDLKARITFDRANPLIAVGDAVYMASSVTDSVDCLDMATGETRWRAFAEGPIRLAPTYHDGRILFGSDDGNVYCVRASDGTQLWKQRGVGEDRRIQGNGRIISAWPIRTGILVDRGQAFFCAGLFPQQGVFHAAIDIETGELSGQTPLNVSAQGYLERRDSRLHVTTGRDPAGTFVSQLSRRGKGVDRAVGTIPQEYPFAFIGDARSRVGGGDGKVAAFAADSGEEIWQAKVEGKAYSMAIAGGNLLVSTDSGFIYCFGQTTEEPRTVRPAKEIPYPWASNQQSDDTRKLVADAIEAAGVRRGWAIVLNSAHGEIAYQIASQSELNVVGYEADETKLMEARRRIDAAGLSDRITFHLAGPDDDLPYTDYLFNLVVNAGSLRNEKKPWPNRDEVIRVTRPLGGLAVFGSSPDEQHRRGPLAGVGEWTHQYANAGNSVCSEDQWVHGPMQLQWFGAPGPRKMMDRHHRPAAPLWAAGRLFIPGDNRVIAADGYNGTPLWDVEIPDSRRAGVYRDSSFMAASAKSLYVAAASKCLQLDAATGKTLRVLDMPGANPVDTDEWGYLATVDDTVFGTRQKYGATRRDHSLEQIKEGTYFDAKPLVCSKTLFALNPSDGTPRWEYRPNSGLIINSTIAIANDRICFVESTETSIAESTGRHVLAKLLAKPARLVALNRKTGKRLWEQSVDLSHIEHVLYLIATSDRLVLAGSFNQKVDGRVQAHFDVRVADVSTGDWMWKQTQNQKAPAGGSHGEQDLHPVVVGKKLYCEPYAYNLESGEPLKDWTWKTGHRRGCGTISASASTFFFRNQNPTMYDLAQNKVTKVTTTTRPGCWINMIPAGGLLLVPEASSGCTCNFSIQSSMAFLPKASLAQRRGAAE